MEMLVKGASALYTAMLYIGIPVALIVLAICAVFFLIRYIRPHKEVGAAAPFEEGEDGKLELLERLENREQSYFIVNRQQSLAVNSNVVKCLYIQENAIYAELISGEVLLMGEGQDAERVKELFASLVENLNQDNTNKGENS